MPKDRDQLTPDEPEDWSELTSGRGQGTAGTGYDRLPGEEAVPPLHDESSAEEVVPDPIDPSSTDDSDTDSDATGDEQRGAN